MIFNIMYVSLLTVFVAQVSKLIYGPFFQGKKLNKFYLAKSGGMPSSHTALMISIVTGLILNGYLEDPIFAIAVAVTLIVINDAMGVRLESGRQAKKLNQLIKEQSGESTSDIKELKEELGHSFIEVLGGIAYGIVVPLVVYLIMK